MSSWANTRTLEYSPSTPSSSYAALPPSAWPSPFRWSSSVPEPLPHSSGPVSGPCRTHPYCMYCCISGWHPRWTGHRLFGTMWAFLWDPIGLVACGCGSFCASFCSPDDQQASERASHWTTQPRQWPPPHRNQRYSPTTSSWPQEDQQTYHSLACPIMSTDCSPRSCDTVVGSAVHSPSDWSLVCEQSCQRCQHSHPDSGRSGWHWSRFGCPYSRAGVQGDIQTLLWYRKTNSPIRR